MRERLGNHHAAFHPAGERHDLRVFLVPERQIPQNLFEVGPVRRLAEQAAAECHGVPYGLEHVGRDFLGHESDLGACGPEVPDDVVAVRKDDPRRGIDDAADDADQRRLARAVWPEQGEDLALADLQVHAFQCVKSRGIDFRELRDRDDRLQRPSRHGVRRAVFLQSPATRVTESRSCAPGSRHASGCARSARRPLPSPRSDPSQARG